MLQPHPPSVVSGITAAAVVPGAYSKASSVSQGTDFYTPIVINGWDYNPEFAAAMGITPSGFLQVMVPVYYPPAWA